jgi:hypothetical protein
MAVQVFLVRECLHDMQHKLHPNGVGLRLADSGGMAVCLVNVVFCQVDISSTGRSLVRRSRTEQGVTV